MAPPTSCDDSPVTGKRILVIEDTTENMRLFRAILKLEGALMLEAADGAAGIAAAQRERPDLILMDIHMPGMDGLTATRILKSTADTASIPVIAVTASVMAADLGKIQEAGCDGYIAKPIDPQTFAQEIVEQAATARHATTCNS